MKIDFLKSKAEDFLKTTEYHFKEKMYHLVAFDLEQALQLFLKYTLFLKTRTYPPIHSIKELLKGAGRIYKKEKEIQKIMDRNLHLISDLEQAYLTSRYLPAEFTKKQVEDMGKFVNEMIKFLQKLWKKQ